jgi:hypothetical protein
LGNLCGAEVPESSAEQVHRDRDDVVESDHALVIQPVCGSVPGRYAGATSL